jgi:two-component system LytT family response regulator
MNPTGKGKLTEQVKPMMKVRVLLVDDEPLAREGLRTELLSHPDVEVVAECANGRAAVSSIREQSPDLIFLDVQMPVLDGFGVIEAVGVERMPVVVFVTAYDEYALRAFEAHALDYLLKPINSERLQAALRRAKEQVSLKNTTAFGQQLADLLQELKAGREGQQRRGRYLKRIPIKLKERVIFVETDDIDWVESQDNYVRLHRRGEAHLLREALSSLESKLDPSKFLRIRRSTLVNIRRVKELRPLFNGEYIIVLQDSTRLQSSRRYRKNLDLLLQP